MKSTEHLTVAWMISIALGFLCSAPARAAEERFLDASTFEFLDKVPFDQRAQPVSYMAGSCDQAPAADCGDGVDCGAAVDKQAELALAVASAHRGVFYVNDFSYLNDPAYDSWAVGDNLKLLPVAGGEWGTLDIGGQLRYRYHIEEGMGREGSPATERFLDTHNEFLLTRLRLYANWKVNEWTRIYVEGLYADSTDDGGGYSLRATDENYGDFLNLFIDLKLSESFIARVGRQELLYGNQRLVSPLDWANIRRTFDGARLLYKSGDWAVDSFYTWFVPVVADELDEADYDQTFYGVYSTYAGFENFAVDTYYLGYDNENLGPIEADFSLHTIGTRLYGSRGDWLWELEGGPQFGRQSGLNQDHSAGFATIGLGRNLTEFAWDPTLWLYYDYASGNAPGGAFNRFNQLFPLAHKYLGFIDAVQRSNIEAPNFLLTAKPAEKWNLLLWYWHFMSNTADIVPAIGNTPSQSASKHYGDELDVLVQYLIGPRSNVLLGWSHLWRGDKINNPEDADFFYVQWETNF